MSSPLTALRRQIRSERSGGPPSRPLRVAVLGPPDLFADRTVDLLRSFGVDARRPAWPLGGNLRYRLERARRGLAADVVFHMSGRRELSGIQTWLARLGVPTLILWIGSDVLLLAPYASMDVQADAWHWCVASWLRDELAESGIDAEVVATTPPHFPEVMPALPPRFTVLAYTLADRSELYGLDLLLELARRRPDIPFFLLGAIPTEQLPDNVTALGWIGDTAEITCQTTVYVRPTAHDGLSNLVLEALANGRHVLWTYPFPGVDTVEDVDAAEARLNELYRQHAEGALPLNQEGREAVLEMFEPSAVRNDILERLRAVTAQPWRRPPERWQRWVAGATLKGLRVLFRADGAWNS